LKRTIIKPQKKIKQQQIELTEAPGPTQMQWIQRNMRKIWQSNKIMNKWKKEAIAPIQ
jgi:ribosomal protein L37AE/L43A